MASEPENLALGKLCTYSPEPNYAHTVSPSDPHKLTDGERAGEGAFHVQRERTVGWGAGQARVVVDLGTVKPIGGVRLSTVGHRNDEMPLPWLTVAVSDDGARFHVVGHLNGLVSPATTEEGEVRRELEIEPLHTRGRFVALLLRTSGWYLFADEVEVLAGAHNAGSVSLDSAAVALEDLERSAQPAEMLCLAGAVRQLEGQLLQHPPSFARAGWTRACAGAERCNAGTGYQSLPSYLDLFSAAAGEALVARGAPRPYWLWSRPRWESTHVWEWPPTFSEETRRLSVVMAQNGWRSQSLLLTNTTTEPLMVVLKPTSPAADAPRLSARYGYPVPCPDYRLRPDALVSWPEQGLRVRAGQTVPVWLTLDARQAAPGRYDYELRLVAGGVEKRVSLDASVLPVRLPAESPLRLFNYSYLREMPLVSDRVEAAGKDLREHWINTYVMPGWMPVAQADDRGELVGTVDFSRVDAALDLHPGATLVWWFGADPNQSLGLFPNLRFLSPEWRKALRTLLLRWIEHLRQRGLEYDDFCFYPYDESTRPEVLQVVRVLKDADPKVRVFLNPTTTCKPGELEALAPFVDIWVPNAEAFILPNAPEYRFLKTQGKAVWTYSCVNGKNLSPYSYFRLKHWLAFREGLGGIGFWGYADCGGWTEDNAWNWARGDFTFVYTEKHAPSDVRIDEPIVPSRRWEAFREGAQDYLLLHLLRQAAEGAADAQARAARRLLDETVKEVLDRPDDTELADAVRVDLLHAILDCRGGTAAD